MSVEVLSSLPTQKGPLPPQPLWQVMEILLWDWIQEKYFFSIYFDQGNYYDRFFLFL